MCLESLPTPHVWSWVRSNPKAVAPALWGFLESGLLSGSCLGMGGGNSGHVEKGEVR